MLSAKFLKKGRSKKRWKERERKEGWKDERERETKKIYEGIRVKNRKPGKGGQGGKEYEPVLRTVSMNYMTMFSLY